MKTIEILGTTVTIGHIQAIAQPYFRKDGAGVSMLFSGKWIILDCIVDEVNYTEKRLYLEAVDLIHKELKRKVDSLKTVLNMNG